MNIDAINHSKYNMDFWLLYFLLNEINVIDIIFILVFIVDSYGFQMKLIIHIGTEKTGSSSLQLWGANNRKQLLDDKVFYSEALGELDHRKASVYAREAHLKDDGFDRYNINNETEHLEFCRKLEIELAKEIEIAKSFDCKFFIVSSEHFHSRIDNHTMVERVKTLFDNYFQDIEILAYIRPQSDLFQSRLSVSVRNASHKISELDSWKKELGYFDYYTLWQRWTRVFDQVTFKPFNESKNIIADVTDMLGIELSAYPKAERVNEKLDYRVGLLTYHMSKYLTSKGINKRLVDIYTDNLPCEFPITISRTLASQINQFYRQSNLLFCQENENFILTHLESDIHKFDITGTAEKMFEDNVEVDFFIPILVCDALRLHIEKCQKKFVEIERALARNNLSNAIKFRDELQCMLLVFEDVNFNKVILKNLSSMVENLKVRTNKLNIGQ